MRTLKLLLVAMFINCTFYSQSKEQVLTSDIKEIISEIKLKQPGRLIKLPVNYSELLLKKSTFFKKLKSKDEITIWDRKGKLLMSGAKKEIELKKIKIGFYSIQCKGKFFKSEVLLIKS